MSINIQFLDHVALRVRDVEASANWYERVLCLKRLQPEQWRAFPIFMIAENGTGIALFPVRTGQPAPLPAGDWIKGDHYAFRLDAQNFERVKAHLTTMSLDFEFQDHHFFHSIYFRDPDGHQLEFTTLVKAIEP